MALDEISSASKKMNQIFARFGIIQADLELLSFDLFSQSGLTLETEQSDAECCRVL